MKYDNKSCGKSTYHTQKPPKDLILYINLGTQSKNQEFQTLLV